MLPFIFEILLLVSTILVVLFARHFIEEKIFPISSPSNETIHQKSDRLNSEGLDELRKILPDWLWKLVRIYYDERDYTHGYHHIWECFQVLDKFGDNLSSNVLISTALALHDAIDPKYVKGVEREILIKTLKGELLRHFTDVDDILNIIQNMSWSHSNPNRNTHLEALWVSQWGTAAKFNEEDYRARVEIIRASVSDRNRPKSFEHIICECADWLTSVSREKARDFHMFKGEDPAEAELSIQKLTIQRLELYWPDAKVLTESLEADHPVLRKRILAEFEKAHNAL